MKVGFTLLRVKQLLSIFVKPIMDKYYKYLEEQNKQLKFLLEFEMMERRQIAGDFHGKAAGMTGAKLYLDILAKKSEKLRSTTVVLSKLLDGAIDNFRTVSRKIHSKDTERYGILLGLNDYLKRNIETRQDVQITNLSTLKENLNIKLEQEIGIYKTCISTLELLLSSGFRKIEIDIKLEGNYLIFYADGSLYKKVPDEEIYDHTIPTALLLKGVKAMLNWQKALVLPQTNWETTFKYRFELIKSV